MSVTVMCRAGDLRVGDRLVAVNGHLTPDGEPAEVVGVGWGLVHNVLRVELEHAGREFVQPLHIDELVEVAR